MNEERRKKIAKLVDQLVEIKSKLQDIASDIDIINDEEKEYLEAMPGSIREGDNWERANEVIDLLSDSFEEFGDTLEGTLDTVIDRLEEAAA